MTRPASLITAGQTVAQAEQLAAEYSRKNPTVYVTIEACFGLFLKTAKRLHVFAPSDSVVKCYWKNGKRMSFTSAQWHQDTIKTPAMA